MNVRTRFAPSPTGHVHIGNMRAAIYNWLFARHHGGKFLVRVEDTDRDRSTPEAVKTIFDALSWLGLDLDEQPLYQSTRMEAHVAAAEELVARGMAYREDKGGTGQGECIIFRMPGEDMLFTDIVKGPLTKRAADLPDFVMVRSNGTPVFHLANVLDDIHMGITHVIRGDDHVENTFRHIALYRALGVEPPVFGHLPMIVNHQGKPYSKRDGAAYVGEFKDNGYLPHGLLNYLALLGWSPGDDREVMTMEELVEAFDLGRVQSSPARMDLKKLLWLNGEHMRSLPAEIRIEEYRRRLSGAGLDPAAGGDDYLQRVITLMEDRVKCWGEVVAQTAFFFTETYDYDEKAVQKRLRKDDAAEHLRALQQRFAALDTFDEVALESALTALAEEQGVNNGALIHPCRVAVSGMAAGPGLYEMLALLGRDRVLPRIDRTLAFLG